MKNWKTTFFGVLAAAALAFGNDLPPDLAGVVDKAAGLFIALGGLLAKDAN